jgi:periplasmic divalent cation tolerance protein
MPFHGPPYFFGGKALKCPFHPWSPIQYPPSNKSRVLRRKIWHKVTLMKLLAIYTTVASRQEAQVLAKSLVERKLVACAQLSEIESLYTWDDEVKQENEVRILFKTTAAQYLTVEAAIRALHPYTLPAVHAVAIERVFEPYAIWVEAQSSGI